MVYIKKVETRGFKSFGSRPVSVNFEGRFIGITGPNGSGKSNIIDAILFAIGENRPRMMRVPKLSGLIFDGAGGNPSTSARVTITLDNTSREISIDNDRVTLTREIRSGGDSVYLLNGKKVQKSTLSDLLRLALISSDGLNFVPQGMVTHLADLDSDEKRGLIEEIVGVAQFDEKKEDALKQLDIADRKLEIAMAKIGEVKKKIDSLEGERNDQLRLQNLEHERNNLKSAIVNQKLEDTKTSINNNNQFLVQLSSEKEKFSEELINDFKGLGSNDDLMIAISVDMLDTGIDVPEIVNLVFAKPIYSYVKFWQMIGRGTRLCKDLYGAGKDKTHFLIFDHWENFEYFDMDPEEEDVKQSKSLTQKLFESRLLLAETALKKADVATFDEVIKLIHQDVCSLDMNTIAVRDNWQVVEACKDEKYLNQFAPETKASLYEHIAPLMQWRNIMGQSEAYKFDNEIAIIQTLLYTDPSQIDLARQALMVKIEKLQMHLNEVRAKASFIADIQKEEYWQNLTASIDGFETLETSRKALRSVIHLREKGIQPPLQEVILDIREDEADYQVTERPTKIVSIDYQIFRQEVEKTLAPLFETDSVLQKIRAGNPVSEDDIARLNALVHIQNPNVDLNTLKEFYPDSTASLDKILRTIVGMDKEAIEQSFTKFVQQTHTHMNAKQQRFIGLLKNHLVRYGVIKIDQLYDAPFTQVHDMGLDGVFSEAQADVIEQFIKQFDVELGQKSTSVDKEIQL